MTLTVKDVIGCFVRYRIQGRTPKKPLQFYATALRNGASVGLKFYPWPYDGLSNCIAKYERAKHNDLVCRSPIRPRRKDHTVSMLRMIEYVPEDERFPPCVVCEDGDFALSVLIGSSSLPPVFRKILVQNVRQITQRSSKGRPSNAYGV